MHKVQLTPRKVLEFIILGIRKGNYQAAIDIAQDCINQLPPDPEPKPGKERIMGEEKLYIGTKLILGIPMSRHEFLKTHQGETVPIEDDQAGYRVSYPDGYISWSPKAVFENAYREVTDGERELF